MIRRIARNAAAGVLAAGIAVAAMRPGGRRAGAAGWSSRRCCEKLVAEGSCRQSPSACRRRRSSSTLAERKRSIGRYGGDIRTLVAKPRDLRYVTVNGYTRLVGYDEKLELKPDILEKRSRTRATGSSRSRCAKVTAGPTASPSRRRTSAIIGKTSPTTRSCRPSGPPDLFLVDGKLPKVEVLDERHIRYSWDKPNPRFLPALAMPRPVFIYSPAHYLKKFHSKYADAGDLAKLATKKKLTSWAALHNKLDDPYEASNIDMPVLDPWQVVTKAPAQRFVFERNPYYHRVDVAGHQLPYVDRVVVDIAAAGLFAAKANAGEVDLLARGLSTGDVPVLKQGEAAHDYHTLLWPVARGSAFALYPNQTTNDPVWRELMRDVRFRRALSLGHRSAHLEQRAVVRARHRGQQHRHPGQRPVHRGKPHRRGRPMIRCAPAICSTRSGSTRRTGPASGSCRTDGRWRSSSRSTARQPT